MITRLVFFLLVSLLATACDNEARQAQGFSLPEGDVERGKDTFVQLGCPGCHLVEGVNQGPEPELSIPLGGENGRKKTYGELVSSVINPTHRTSVSWLSPDVREAGRSQMQSYNEFMTVQELVDIVAFLQLQYRLEPVSRMRYLKNYQDRSNGDSGESSQ